MKRFLAVLLCAALLLSITPASVSVAAENCCELFSDGTNLLRRWVSGSVTEEEAFPSSLIFQFIAHIMRDDAYGETPVMVRFALVGLIDTLR